MLDRLIGEEQILFMRERQLKGVIEKHIESDGAEIDFIEGRGALNFLDIDDVPISEEGEIIDPGSIVTLPTTVDLPLIPEVTSPTDPFLVAINASGRKWVILIDDDGNPQLVLDADAYLRNVMTDTAAFDAYSHCHRPIIITDANSPLGHIIERLREGIDVDSDAAIDKDIVLLWTDEVKKVITGADLLGRLLRGI
jgi:hypothetical protein